MTNSQDLNSLLLSHNPFYESSVRYQNIWGQQFLDVNSLNAHASDAVFQAVKQNRTTSIVITAEYGTGKTHIIARIRHQLQTQGEAFFAYINRYDITGIKPGFQNMLADSLKNNGSSGVKQWQELATNMANHVFKVSNNNAKTFSPVELVKKIEKFEQTKPEEFKQWVTDLTKGYCKNKQVNNPDIVRAIFWTLSGEQILYAVSWLAGQEIAQFKANELGLPTQSQSFDAVLQILDLISEYNTLVICFDELDSHEIDPDTALTKAQVVAVLIKELFENLKRGVILSVMIPAVWNHKVKPMPGLSWRKVSDYGEPIDLRLIDENSVIELVKLRLSLFYQEYNLVPPYPLYPFQEEELRNIGKRKSSTVREVLAWCKEQLPKKLNGGVKFDDPVEQAFETEMKEDLGNYLDDNPLLADALLFGFQSLIGQTVDRVTVQKVIDKVNNDRRDRHINFKIIGKEEGKSVKIGVAVLQYAGGGSLGTGLSKLNDYKTFGLTRACLVRSKDRKMTEYMKNTHLTPLIKKGGEVVELKEEEIKPLLAIRAVHQKREVDYKGITEKQIFKFIAEKGADKMLGASNPLLKEILSDPSYQVPEGITFIPPTPEAAPTKDDKSNVNNNIEEAIEALVNKLNFI